MYEDVARMSAELDLRFSFYIDDIAVSGQNALSSIDRVNGIIRRNGHILAWKKLRVMPRSGRQDHVGCTINHRVSNGGEKIQKIKLLIYQAAESCVVSRRQLQRIDGMIAQASYIDRAQGEMLRRIADKRLVDVGYDNSLTAQERPVIIPCDSFARHRKGAGRPSLPGLRDRDPSGVVA
jgi:hypothetical protein